MEHQKEAVLHSYNLISLQYSEYKSIHFSVFITLEMPDLLITTSGTNRFYKYA